jgi:hypothetical protein
MMVAVITEKKLSTQHAPNIHLKMCFYKHVMSIKMF